MLTFTGVGSAFNTALGNNSCYIKDGNKLFLIDCGSSTFNSMLKKGVLEGVEHITVFITHLHPDHVGSLGDLIFYMYYTVAPNFKPKVTITTVEHLQIERLLYLMGIEQCMYDTVRLETNTTYTSVPLNLSFRPVKVEHVKQIDTHGLVIYYNNEVVYYSADSTHIPSEILNDFLNEKISRMYQDVSGQSNSVVHMPYNELVKIIPDSERDRVYCMHLDAAFDVQQALKDGFNVAQ